jgi:DNA-binding SARP family transcriptional activator
MSEPGPSPVIHLIGGPYVCYGNEERPVPEGSKKLLAFVALRLGRVERPYAAGALWPFGGDPRAAGNLRSALWRLRRAGIDVVEADKWSLQLAADVEVDVHRLAAWASRLIHSCPEPEDLSPAVVPEMACHLLPGWYDEWAVLERERIRQRVLHALEALSTQLSRQGRHAEAVEAALRAVLEEPLRESGQRALLAAYLAQGNLAEARRAYVRFARLLHSELGVEPSRQVTALLAGRQAMASTDRRAAGRS